MLPGDDAPECVTIRPSAAIARFYVDKAWQGAGVARSLMAAAMEDIGARRARGVWLGVWEHNVRAVHFYRKHGFRDIGSHVFVLGSDVQTDRIMFREVVAAERGS
jgi:ribosomal protein S18 acetylase RimI-like enzyme